MGIRDCGDMYTARGCANRGAYDYSAMDHHSAARLCLRSGASPGCLGLLALAGIVTHGAAILQRTEGLTTGALSVYGGRPLRSTAAIRLLNRTSLAAPLLGGHEFGELHQSTSDLEYEHAGWGMCSPRLIFPHESVRYRPGEPMERRPVRSLLHAPLRRKPARAPPRRWSCPSAGLAELCASP